METLNTLRFQIFRSHGDVRNISAGRTAAVIANTPSQQSMLRHLAAVMVHKTHDLVLQIAIKIVKDTEEED